MEKKNFLFITIDALCGDLAWQISKEGHDVKFYTRNPDDKEVGDGFFEKVDDWKLHVEWADIIVFDDVLGQGKKAKELRDKGKAVIGGTPYTDMLEDDRSFGQEELKKLESKLAEEGYIGYIDINCIVNSNGIYPLEFTSRFGYPTISIQQDGMLTPIGEFLYLLAVGEKPKLKVKSGFQVGVRIVVPPFPYTDKETFDVKSKDSIIFFKNNNKEGVHIEDVKLVNGEWLVTGNSGVILIVCGTGQTLKQAQNQAYLRIKNIRLPHMYYRKDIGDRWYEDSDKLHCWGYLRES